MCGFYAVCVFFFALSLSLHFSFCCNEIRWWFRVRVSFLFFFFSCVVHCVSCVRNIHFAPAHILHWKPKSINETNRLCILQKARMYNECVTRAIAWRIERDKSRMIDVVVGILFMFFENEPMLPVWFAWLVGKRFWCLPIPLQYIYIAFPENAMDICVAFHLISAFLWLILLSWCIMNDWRRDGSRRYSVRSICCTKWPMDGRTRFVGWMRKRWVRV